MTPDSSDRSGAALEAMLARAAEQGAKRVLADLGLDGEDIPDYKITKVDDLLPWRWNG